MIIKPRGLVQALYQIVKIIVIGIGIRQYAHEKNPADAAVKPPVMGSWGENVAIIESSICKSEAIVVLLPDVFKN